MISKIVSWQVPMRPMTSDEHKLHEAARECVNYGVPFSDRNLKVHHHDHVSGEYLFPACQKCNLLLKPRKVGKKRKYCSDGKENYEKNFFLVILFHTLKNYDAHFVLKHFEKKYVEHHGEDGSVSVVRRRGSNAPKFRKISSVPNWKPSLFGLVSVSFHVARRTGILTLKERKG